MKLKRIPFFAAIYISLFILSCSENNSNQKEDTIAVPDFTTIKNKEYFEVKRRFSNGLSFDTSGFQLEPLWILNFQSNDSVMAFSSERARWHTFPILHDHDNVFNMVFEFFRVKSIHQDSLVFQRLEVRNNEVKQGYLSDVNMTFYSRDYIFNKLKTNPIALQKPTKKDTIFINELIQKVDPKTGQKVPFAARNIVQFIPKVNTVSASVENKVSKVDGKNHSSLYMEPKYKITINKSYKKFDYLFTAIIDEKGNIKINKVYGVLKDAEASRKKLLQGIADVYLKNLFKVIPGTTLGRPHASEVEIYLIGRK